MKVLFLSSWFPNRVTPVNGDFVERHAIAVSALCKTAVIHVASDPYLRGRFIEITRIRKDALFEVIIYFRRSNNKVKKLAELVNNLLYGIGYFIGYNIVLKEMGKPDVIHANIINPIAKIAGLFHLFTGIPYIISEHWTGFLSSDPCRIPGGIKKAVRNAFALVPVTQNLRKALERNGFTGRYSIVTNTVNTKLFRPDATEIPQRKTRLLHVSSMKEEHKNITGIIRTVSRLHDIRNDFSFTFVGDVQPQQKELARDLKLTEDTLLFAGEVEHRNVAAIMQQSHALVMFSRVENFPCVIAEALACGLPVLSSNVGGISEWINDSNGILVEPEDENGLLTGMNYMVDNYHKYDKERLHKYADEHFSYPNIAKRFVEIYNQALKLKSG